MDHLPLAIVPSSPEGKRVVDAYKKAVTTVATATAYVMLARGMARELLPDELRAAVRWGVELVRARLGRTRDKEHRETNTVVIRRNVEFNTENHLFSAALTYLASTIDPRTMRRLCVARSKDKETDGSSSWSTSLRMEPGGSTTDTFDGVVFTWTSAGSDDNKDGGGHWGPRETTLELSFFAEHTDTALERYVPFVMSTAEQLQRQDRSLKIFLNEGGWNGINHHHPATFDTLAMDLSLKQAIIDDIDRFLKRKEYYLRIGKAWKRGYLLYGPPGTGKSSLVAAMANYLRFNLYDLDLSKVYDNSNLHRLLMDMPNKSILVIEDIDCCFDAKSREKRKTPKPPADGDNNSIAADDDNDDDEMHDMGAYRQHNITLSGLLNFIDGLWSTSGEERIIIFTTNYKDRLDPALLRPGRMDMHIHMGYCGWEAFQTLAHNYFDVDDHALFPEIQALLTKVEATPAEVSEMLLRSEDVETAMPGLVKFLQDKRRGGIRKVTEIKNDQAAAQKEMK
ncbi:AAA-ATPase At3g50940 [Lolium perenne]|uniref:AAA-ATPase At3g50940 n=1 Tax=Lolium perenne TaxID=4522 RepID=UPI0021EA8932|nr:AAA-ATPase At3g50940-like [Lolium perenne]